MQRRLKERRTRDGYIKVTSSFCAPFLPDILAPVKGTSKNAFTVVHHF